MIQHGGTFLQKARESAEGAKVEYEGARYNNCANRAYYACFQAAIHALQSEGIRLPGSATQWGHDFVQAQFVGQLINRRHRYETALRIVLEQNQRLRVRADYEVSPVTEILASRALQRAERFVGAVVQRQEELQ